MKLIVLSTLLLTLGCAAPASLSTSSVAFPEISEEGKPIEVSTLVNEDGLKIKTITLRAGKVLPVHTAPSPVTIMALQGSGELVSGEERFPLDPGHAVLLAAEAPHEVIPDEGTTMVLLIHYLATAK